MKILKKFIKDIPIIVFILILFSLIMKFYLIFQEIDIVIQKLMADDSFYYHVIARNIVNGNGITFNEKINTNGFHPLYAFILVPLHFMSPNNMNVPIYLSLIVISLFSVFTSLFIYKIVKEILGINTGIIASAIWLFTPSLFFLSLLGMETSLQVFFISVLTYKLITWDRKVNYTPRESLIIGFLCALIFLSRMDGLFFCISIIIVLIFRKLKSLESIKKIFKINIKDIFIIGITALLLVSPWLIWSYFGTNSLFPTSGETRRLYYNNPVYYVALQGLFDTINYFGGQYIKTFELSFMISPIVPSLFSISLIVLLTLAFISISFILLLILDRKFLINIAKKFDFLILTAIFFYIYFIFYQKSFRPWYFNFPFFLCGIFVPIIIIQTIRRIRSINPKKSLLTISLKVKLKKRFFTSKIKLKPLTGVIFCFLFSIFAISGVIHYNNNNGYYPDERTKYFAALWINENLPKNSVIGSFNTGIIQYYTPNFDVINLDGVVNYEAYIYRKNDNTEQYILERNITYLIDPMYYIQFIELPSHNLTLIRSFDTGDGGIYYLYHLVPM